MKTPHDLWLVVAAVVAMGWGLFAAIDAAVSTSLRRPGRGPGQGQAGGRSAAGKISKPVVSVMGLAVLLRVAWRVKPPPLPDRGGAHRFRSGRRLGPAGDGGRDGGHLAMAVGVGPRTLGRQHAYSLSLASAFLLQFFGVLLRRSLNC